jgi:hypothetical protein
MSPTLKGFSPYIKDVDKVSLVLRPPVLSLTPSLFSSLFVERQSAAPAVQVNAAKLRVLGKCSEGIRFPREREREKRDWKSLADMKTFRINK